MQRSEKEIHVSVWNDGGPRAGGGRGGQRAGLGRIAALALPDSLISQTVNWPHLPAGQAAGPESPA